MAVKKNENLGKVLKSHNGFRIRQELKRVENETLNRFGNVSSRTIKYCDNGTVAIFAGKKMKKAGIKNVAEAITIINKY